MAKFYFILLKVFVFELKQYILPQMLYICYLTSKRKIATRAIVIPLQNVKP